MNAEQYARMRAVEDTHWWYVGTRAITADVLDTLSLPRAARILDAGCGTGGNTVLLERYGRTVGFDASDLALDLAADRGFPLARADTSLLPFVDAAFDLVASFDVLCHRTVDDDVAAMRELRRVIRPGGWLLLRLPALDWLRGAHDVEVHTVRRYSAAGVRRKLRAAGLEPTRVTYMNALLTPLAAVKRVAERIRGSHGDDLGPTAPPLTVLFRGALALERRLLLATDLPLGVSLMALARRLPDR